MPHQSGPPVGHAIHRLEEEAHVVEVLLGRAAVLRAQHLVEEDVKLTFSIHTAIQPP